MLKFEIEEYLYNDLIEYFKITDDDYISILPIRYNLEEKVFHYSEETPDFYKFLKTKTSKVNIIKETDDYKLLALHSNEIWIPIIYIAEMVLLPLTLNFIYDYVKNKMSKKNNINLKMIVKTKDKRKCIKYDGDIEGLKQAFKKIDVNKFFDE